MPVTLVLTDDQALDIVSQVSALLQTKKLGFPNGEARAKYSYQKGDSASGVTRVRDYVNMLTQGSMFTHNGVWSHAGKSKVSTHAVSLALKKLSNENVLKMIKRGHWQKL